MSGAPIFMLGTIPVSNITMDEAIDEVFNAVHAHTPQSPSRHMHFVNAHCINVASRDSRYHDVLTRADSLLPDGSGIRLAGKMLGTEIKDNVNGTDMFPLLCRRCAETGKRIYLLGAKPGVAEKAAQWAVSYCGKDIISGFSDGYFPPEQNLQIIDEINQSRTDILLTAMGVPNQEIWLDANREHIHVPVCMGVGGLLDFYSGTIPRAPRIMRRLGVEWIWRLMMEPSRMWRRYIIGNVVFIMRIKRIQRDKKT